MSDTNPQIEKQLDKLATICCSLLEADGAATTIEDPAVDTLLESLLMSGYARRDGANLQADIERRVKNQCRESAMHRGGALSSLTGQLQKKFAELTHWESRQPGQPSEPRPANISSATDK